MDKGARVMEITVFKDITTEDSLLALEADGKKYAGLYVDMNDKPSRKYVKDQAVLINDLIKKVDRKRIDESKAYKLKVEAEACIIISRLKAANEPYSLLIDAYKAERAKILADEKLVIELRQLAIDKEDDHEMALLINKTFEYDRLLEIKQQEAEAAQMQKEANDRADIRQKQAIIESLQREKNAENARLADKEHVRNINSDALHGFMAECNLDYEQAKVVVIALAKKKILNVTINY